MRIRYSRWRPDHTKHWKGRRPKQFTRVWRRGVPGHYAPRCMFSLPDALWIGRLKSVKRLFGHTPPHIGGGRPFLFMITRRGGSFYRKLDDRGGFNGWWSRKRPSFVPIAKAVMNSPAGKALRESMARD